MSGGIAVQPGEGIRPGQRDQLRKREVSGRVAPLLRPERLLQSNSPFARARANKHQRSETCCQNKRVTQSFSLRKPEFHGTLLCEERLAQTEIGKLKTVYHLHALPPS